MSLSCLPCSQRALVSATTRAATKTRSLRQSTRRFHETKRQPQRFDNTLVQWKGSYRQWHERGASMDARSISRTAASAIFSPDERDEDTTKRPLHTTMTTQTFAASPHQRYVYSTALFNPLFHQNKFAIKPQMHQRRCYKTTIRRSLEDDKRTPSPSLPPKPYPPTAATTLPPPPEPSAASASSASASSITIPNKPRPPPLLRAIKVPHFGLDTDDKAVRSFQHARKEKAREKTAANVRRALYGNLIICTAKLGAWLSSGSSSMMSEFVHSVVDCGNQALLLMGLHDSGNVADRRHPYGYGKSVYFWALVSALGTFFLGAGISMSHAVGEIMEPSLSVITNEVWAVLVMSFCVDGYVLWKTVSEIQSEKPNDLSFWQYTQKIRDPATLAVLLEDGAACLGIVIAIAGIGASHATANPIFDGMAGVGISCLLGGIGLALVRVNHRFLIGQGVEREMLDGIEKIIRSRSSIDHVSSIQSQWTGPETFSFKAEIDFDGTYLSALLMPRYQSEFNKADINSEGELQLLMSWYAEDVIRAIEREVRHIEAMIRQKYPGAEYIELEPMSKYADKMAIDDSFEDKLLLIEKEELQRLVRVLHEKKDPKAPTADAPATGSADNPDKL